MARIRVYTPFFPYPLNEAAYQTMFYQAHDLARLGHQVEIVTWKDSNSELAKKQKAAAPVWNPAIKIIAWPSMPESKIGRFGRVARSVLTNSASPELFYYPLESDQRASLEAVDLEIYHYSFAHSWLKRFRGNAKRVAVHFHNLESDLFRIRASTSNLLTGSLHSLSSRKLLRHEIELAKMVNEIWQHSPADKEAYEGLIANRSMTAIHRVVTPTIDPSRLTHRWETASTNSEYLLGFIGGLDFEPNKLSMMWIIENLAPLIAEKNINKIKIIHAGKRSEDVEVAAKKYPFISFMGFVDDIETWWSQLSWTLVPDLTGAGIRVKLLESLASKVPVLATSRAVERLPESLRSEPALFVSDHGSEWLEKILSEPPLMARKRAITEDFPKGLTGDHVYQFMKNGT